MKELKLLRLECNHTQADVAKSVGISQQHYSSIEKGAVKPSLIIASRIASYFDTTIDDIFFESNTSINCIESDN